MSINEFIAKSKQNKSPLLKALRSLSASKVSPTKLCTEEAIFTMEPW